MKFSATLTAETLSALSILTAIPAAAEKFPKPEHKEGHLQIKAHKVFLNTFEYLKRSKRPRYGFLALLLTLGDRKMAKYVIYKSGLGPTDFQANKLLKAGIARIK